ncbi:MAG: hypothetical protein Q9162_000500 [Coniocarpon cinnabarinum]
MPRAEVGSTKWVANKQKSKGLQRLRWYCQACEKQCRDENGFKCHTQSESHVRQMMLIGEDPRKHIHEYSQQFFRAFMQQLKTAHGTKPVHINHFYQEYIQDKEHIHMNATKWKSLTDFAKYLGQEGLCRVEETDKGIHIAWIDNSPEALRRQAAVQKAERMERNDENMEQRLLRQQIHRARDEAENRESSTENYGQDLERREGERMAFSFGSKQKPSKPPTPPQSDGRSGSEGAEKDDSNINGLEGSKADEYKNEEGEKDEKAGKAPVKMSLGGGSSKPSKQKPRSMAALFGGGKKAAGQGVKRAGDEDQPKKVSEAERVMRQEMERNKGRQFQGLGAGSKRIKLG